MPDVKVQTLADARLHLTQGPDERLSAERVTSFITAARDDPRLRLKVLTMLRAHSANGSETPLAGIGVLLAAVAVFATIAAQSLSGWSWLFWLAWSSFTLFGRFTWYGSRSRRTYGD